MTLADVVASLDESIGRFAGLALLLTWVVVGAVFVWLRREQHRYHENLSQTLHTLRYEIDEGRQMFQVPTVGTGTAVAAQNSNRVSRAQYDMELEAYRDIWNALNELHRSLGLFLRSIENRDRYAEHRQQTRTAATEAKDVTSRLMPFYHESVERIVTSLLDRYIYLHLSACSYLDGQVGEQLESLPLQQSVTLDILRERTHTLYDNEAKQQLKELAHAIRRRLMDGRVVE